VLRNNISIKEKDGGGPRYIFIDRICTIKEIYEKIVQTYFGNLVKVLLTYIRLINGFICYI